MYQSPIKLVSTDPVIETIKTKTDEMIYRAVTHADVQVDRDELIKALQYDRGQYQKGYADRDSEIVRCKDCKHYENSGWFTQCFRHNGISPNSDWFCADGERK